jgi:uncharacterized SAM-binding protein YcdF (DUF218 family)
VSLFLSKLLPVFVYPLGFAIVLAGLALWRGGRIGRGAAGLSVVVLWLASMPVSSNWLVAQLEGNYPAAPIDTVSHADVAIVLGGSIGQPVPPRVEPDLYEAADRILYAARIFRAGKVGHILVSGGNLPWEPAAKPESQLVSDLLIEFGVPSQAIVQDPTSQTTRENAVNSAAILAAQGWHTALLITSAIHMPRALAVFLRVGVQVIPATTDVRVVLPLYRTPLDVLPDAAALAQTTEAIKELIGLAVYRVRGWA